ncbi:uncharacterized protein LOC108824976 [Raphanus sativus]|uniref:Uncharacterized protein LOC108824976 n=1 Tax=Raphanus sativus TaxID=3726 RepID=A0A6J0L313_RAPSA|nr:uncharacterized protein LOC108824976 [Raphanus sativus]
MVRGALPLGANLRNHGINTTGTCPHCNEDETALHLFFLCPFEQQVWNRAPLRSLPDFSGTSSLHEAFEIMSTCLSLPPIGVASKLTSCILWGIWTTRNLLLFENRALPAKTAMDTAASNAREWSQAQPATDIVRQPLQIEPELPPIPTDALLCNSDAAWISDTRRAGLGWLFRKADNTTYSEGSRALELVSSPLMAEALAMREALLEAKRLSHLKVWFRTDSRELARAINSKSYPMELFVANSIAKSALHNSRLILY